MTMSHQCIIAQLNATSVTDLICRLTDTTRVALP